MRIQMICPAPSGTRHGNRTTALRWAAILRHLGHRVSISQLYEGAPCDVLLALHARRSADAVLRFHREHPEQPVIVALTGTDVYGDIHRSRKAQRVLEIAARLVVLQPLALEELKLDTRKKARVILQSAIAGRGPAPRRDQSFFDVCVIGHLRAVKDPLRSAYASRLLPAASRIRVLQAGKAMEKRFEHQACREQERNPRYRWLGELSNSRTRKLMARSRLMVLSSLREGGANVISEALVDGVPVIASRIPGSAGLLGEKYPGYFPAGDTRALADLLWRAESDAGFYQRLKTWCSRLAPNFTPAREQAAWKKLLAEVTRSPAHPPSPAAFRSGGR